jgi:hypothetical protein
LRSETEGTFRRISVNLGRRFSVRHSHSLKTNLGIDSFLGVCVIFVRLFDYCALSSRVVEFSWKRGSVAGTLGMWRTSLKSGNRRGELPVLFRRPPVMAGGRPLRRVDVLCSESAAGLCQKRAFRSRTKVLPERATWRGLSFALSKSGGDRMEAQNEFS